MKIHSIVQGSPEWHAHRANHFNASDAPAMMGLSAYKTRTQLLHELHTGLTPDVDAATQRRFDDGHRFEALARPLAEEFIGLELYPVTGSEGKLSASFDGLTMCETTGFEHKSLNDNLRAIMVEGCSGGDLDMQYQVQMEQQLMVSGAGRILFMASKWNGDELVEECHCWYESDAKLRSDILQGWTQFAIDLAAYEPVEVVSKAVGHTPESLPALRIEVTGMVTASNLAQYKEHALAVFAGINKDLKTDQDFADADKIVKWCGDVEDRLAAAKQHALSQTESIDALFRTIDDISTEARRTRLELDKLVKARKEALRGEIVAEGAAKAAMHIAAMNDRLGKSYMPHVPADFGGAIKGKRTVDSIRDAVDTELARFKIEASAIADRIQINLNTLRELAAGHAFLFADTAQIVLKQPEDLTMLVKSRIADHQAAEAKKEAEQRERIRAEEVAKLAREQSERDRLAAKALADAAVLEAQKAAPAPVIIAPVAMNIAAQTLMHGNLPVTQAQFDKTYPIKAKPATPPDLKLGQMAERLGFTVTADFLKTLGFEPAATDRASKLYHESDFPRICAALVDHINTVCETA